MRLLFCLHALLLCLMAGPVHAAEADSWPLRFLARFDAESQRLTARIAAAEAELAALARIPPELTGERLGYHSRIQMEPLQPLWVQVDLSTDETFETVVIVPVVLPREQGGIEGYGFPRGFRLESAPSPDGAHATVLAELFDVPNPGRNPIIIPCQGAQGRYVRLTATAPAGTRSKSGKVIWPSLALAEIMVLRGDRNLAAGRAVTAPTSREAAPVWSLQNLTDSQSILGAPVASATTQRKGWHSIAYARADTPVTITLDLGQPMPLDDVRLFPMRWEGYPHWVGFGFPVRFKIECALEQTFLQPNLIEDLTHADFPNPGMNPVVTPANGVTAQFVRVTATRQWERFTDHAVALSEVQVFSNGRNAALGTNVTTSSVYPDEPWANEHLTDGDASDNPILPLSEWIAQLQKSASLQRELSSLKDQHDKRLTWLRRILVGLGIALGAIALKLPTFFLIRSVVRRRRELRQLRERISRDLHDEVGSNLAGIALLSREAAEAPEPQRQALLQEIQQVAEETAGSMRDLVWMIQPGAPGDLIGGLRTLAERMLKGRQVTFQPPPSSWKGTLALEAKRDLYLICKEALQNIVKHSAATRVDITLQTSGQALCIRIADNGRGFNATSGATGFGLPNLRERAKRLGGTCHIESAPGQGTTVRVQVPLT